MNSDNLNDIFMFLLVETIMLCSSVCKQWHEVAKSENIWKCLFAMEFDSEIDTKYRKQYKDYYILDSFLREANNKNINDCIKTDYISIERAEFIPKQIGMLTNLTSLNITETLDGILPKEIYSLTKLKRLSLTNNQLNELPINISNLVNLSILDCMVNNIKALPADFTCLTNLKQLYLNENKFTEYPIELNRMITLKTINLEENPITKIPEDISDLINLKNLYLDYCELETVPESMAQLTNLYMLNLGENPLKCIPLKVQQLSNLQIKIDKDKKYLIEHPQHKCTFTNFSPMRKLVRDPLTGQLQVYIKVKNPSP